MSAGKAWGRTLSGQCGGPRLQVSLEHWVLEPCHPHQARTQGQDHSLCEPASRPRSRQAALSSARHPHASRAAPQGQVAKSCFLVQLGAGTTWRLESCPLSRTQLLLAQWAGG